MGRTVRRAGACTIVLLGLLAFVGLAGPAAAVSPDVVISQVYGGGGNSGATFSHDFIELYNRSSSPVSLAGWSLQYASATGTGNLGANATQLTELSGTIGAGEYLLVQEASNADVGDPLPTPGVVDPTPINMSGGAGKVALVTDSTGLGCNGGSTPCGSSQLARIRDLVGYGTANFFEGAGAAPTLTSTTAALRDDGGETDTDDNAADFTAATPTPRQGPPPEDPEEPGTGCATPATHQIAQVQGSGVATPVANQVVRIEGVVTGDFQGPAQLGGFFVQDDTPDTDPATSDGIFVFTTLAAAVGDRVLVNGRAIEFSGLTELSPVTAVDVCGTGTVAPAATSLPRAPGTTFEPVEGVLLTFPETLTATEHFQLGRFGEVTVSSEGRLIQPTNEVAPGAPAQAALELASRRRLLIDDGSTAQNPATIPFVAPGNALRLGDTTSGVTGVLSFGFGLYRLQPTAPITFQRTNPRPAAPAAVGGDVQVASFNTLNYFTTLGDDNPDARGADDATELARQQAKEVAAITGLDADVLGLMEVENNGTTAIASLVAALNAATAPNTYAFITDLALNPPNEFGGTFGTDAIKVAIVYKPAVVTPIGPAQSSADPIFDRPPLVQTFAPVAGGEPFTVAVNHFKSKNCGDGAPGDADLGDGQSCFNARRVLQAGALATLLDALDPPNPLLLGDLNSYAMEDPIVALEAAGYTRLVPDAGEHHSFVFDGFAGELDHAMASAGLLDNVTGTAIWHINADEPLVLDYNTEFNPPALYAPDAYRSSDHDPLLVGLELSSPPAAPAVSALAGWGAATVSWTAPADGGSPITGYTLTVRDGTKVVATVPLGPGVTSHTIGGLTNGVTYTFEVVATNAVGSGPAGVATARPFVPTRYTKLRLGVSCPVFTATNPNAFPVAISWQAIFGTSGIGVVPAGATVPLGPGRVMVLYAGANQLQGIAVAIC